MWKLRDGQNAWGKNWTFYFRESILPTLRSSAVFPTSPIRFYFNSCFFFHSSSLAFLSAHISLFYRFPGSRKFYARALHENSAAESPGSAGSSASTLFEKLPKKVCEGLNHAKLAEVKARLCQYTEAWLFWNQTMPPTDPHGLARTCLEVETKSVFFKLYTILYSFEPFDQLYRVYICSKYIKC